MAESKNSFIQSKMNKDLDERLVPNNVYRDGQNIAVSRSEGSDVGSLEAILGNKKVYDNTGLNCIGYITDEANGYIYYFLTSFDGTGTIASTDKCQICRYNPSSNQNTILVGGSSNGDGIFLNFSTAAPIYGINLLEDLLFWTDNRNQPRKINVTTAMGNPGSTGFYQTEQSISVCKYSPFIAPVVVDLRSVAPGAYPSTMTDAADPSYVDIGVQKWTSDNLNVSRYRNGDDILFCDDAAAWAAANAATTGAWCWYNFDQANEAVYGKLYNKYAVNDSRNLAPYGHSLPTDAQFNTFISGSDSSTNAQTIKSINLWAGDVGTDVFGFDALPAGEVNAAGTASGVTTTTTYWADSASTNYLSVPNTNATGVSLTTGGGTASDLGVGRSVRLLRDASYKGWGGDPEFIRDKFVRFSYRFKYTDNEYSLIAPFTQECFIPQQSGRFLGDDEEAAFRSTLIEFMQNSINNIVLNIELPSLDIITDYQVSDIDIIYKESDSLDYKILQTIPVNNTFIGNLNNTTIYQYTYQSTIPYKTLPQDETTRVYDKVPVKALAQEAAGNRIMYSNFVQGYNQPSGLDYYVGVQDKGAQNAEEYPQHSIKQNRNYQVGIILADKWGRQSDVILSSKDNILVDTGEPVEGSNYFTTYKPQSFYSSVKTWPGDELKITFDSVVQGIGETDLYANPITATGGSSTYTITYPMSGPNWPGFWNWSTQELTTVANQRQYTFTNLSYQDNAPLVFSLFLNQGEGWVLVDPTNYTTGDSGDDEILVTYTNIIDTDLTSSITTNSADATNGDYTNATWSTSGSGTGLVINVTVAGNAVTVVTVVSGGKGFAVGDTITIGTGVIGGSTNVIITLVASDIGGPTTAGWKLLGKNFYNTTQYRYEIRYPGLDTGFPTNTIPNTTAIFGAGRYLRGKYSDYVEIQTFSQISNVDKYFIYTNKEIADNYMFQGDSSPSSNPTTRTEPLATQNINNSTYSLNQMGWYSYRVVVKQQEQEYYNVYLPGIVNGYPIANDTAERDETAFVTLIGDNLNKVPRDLAEAAPNDTQFNSKVTWFGRVTNNANATYKNQQTVPTVNPDTVNVLSTIINMFPGITTYDDSAGNINDNCIFDIDQRPVLGKISTQKTIGVTENLWTAATPYPDAMGLAVYETSPTFTFLELFYETSNSALISDLNTDIVSSGTAINGITDPNFVMYESACAGTTVTSTFYPTTPDGNDLLTTALDSDMEVRQYEADETTINLTGPDRSADFTLVPNGSGGYTVEVQNPQAALTNYEYEQKYWFNIKFTQADGTESYQSFTGALQNVQPNATTGLSPNIKVNETVILDYNSTFSLGGSNPGYVKGDNGSCNDCDQTGDLNWVISQITIVDINGGLPITGTETGADAGPNDIDYYFRITGQQVYGDCLVPDNYWACRLERTTATYTDPKPKLHTITLRLYDTNGTGDYDDLVISFTPQDIRYDGEVVYSSYNTGYSVGAGYYQTTNITPMNPSCGGSLLKPRFLGEIQNWKNVDVYVYINTVTTSLSGSSTLAYSVSGNNSNPTSTTGPADGASTVNNYSGNSWPQTDSYSLGNPINQNAIVCTLKAFTPTATQINDGVKPGDTGFEDCVLVNVDIKATTMPCGEGAAMYMKYSLTNPGVTFSNISAISPTQPPLIGQTFPHTTPWPA